MSAPARDGGRRADEPRAFRLVPNWSENPLASVLCELGRTRVLCTVSEEAGVPRWLSGQGRGWVTAEYSMLPGATAPRGEREAARGRPSGRTQEIQRLIGRSLRAVTELEALGERTLWLDCDVLQADGGTRCASITGAWVALALAERRLLRRGAIARPLLRDSVAALSGGVVGGAALLDLAYQEDSRADVDLNVVATGAGRLVEVQATGERATFGADELSALLASALRAIAGLAALQRAAVEQGEPA